MVGGFLPCHNSSMPPLKGRRVKKFLKNAIQRTRHPKGKVGKFLKKTKLVSTAARLLGNIPPLAELKPIGAAVGMLGYGRRKYRVQHKRKRKRFVPPVPASRRRNRHFSIHVTVPPWP